ncbi:MAG TPA: tetratricopeptide repeat protein [Chthoniobacterales bacterium]|jgi:Flp pilus assembly protein TadD|nr:tetratricopeptide repeat protein [Chthoniobacterales bacterium]
MKVRELAVISLLLTSLSASGVSPVKPELERMYDTAFRAFDAADYDEALKALDAIDARQPDLAESLNLRGVIYMRQRKYEKAEASFRKALSIEPKFWNARFNLAEIPFLRKDWTLARNRFEALVSGERDGMEPETTHLIQYKILLTFLLQDNESMVDWLLEKFELWKDSPALYYSSAAIAFDHDNQKEGTDWLAAAGKRFSPEQNKLYAESLYEVGFMEKPAGEPRPAIGNGSGERADRLRAEGKANFEKAEQAFQNRDFDEALHLLDLAGESAPNDAASSNLRGEIFLAEKKFDEAEAAFRQALEANPKFREAEYNVAQIPLKKGEYQKARDRFEALFAETPADDKNQAAQLIKFKIYLTFLLEGKDEEAQRMLDQFKFTGDTPALYYAQAAWNFQHGDPEQGNDWVASAHKLYSPPLNIVFADSLYDFGWLKQEGAENTVPTAALAQANASPQKEPTPEMRLGQAEPIPAPSIAKTEEPAANPTAIGGAALVAPSISPGLQRAAPTIKPAGPAITKVAPPTGTSARSHATADWRALPPNGLLGRISNRGLLFAAGLFLAGVVFLVWLVTRRSRRRRELAMHAPEEASADLLAAEHAEAWRKERQLSAALVAGQPPQVSLDLQAGAPDEFEKAGEPAEEDLRRATADQAEPQEEQPDLEPVTRTAAADEALASLEDEPIGQGPPIPQLTSALSPEPVISELAQPEPKTDLILVEPDGPIAAPIAAHEAVQSSIEAPSFAPKVISTGPSPVKSETPAMPETETASSPAAQPFAFSPSAERSGETGGTAVEVTFSLEIASMQLAPNLKMASLRLKPASKVVSVRFASAQNAQSPLDLNVTFEISKIELTNGNMSRISLAPSNRKPPPTSNNGSLVIETLRFVPGEGAARVQLTAAHQEQASVQLAEAFQIAAIEFDPRFEISAVVLNARSNKVSIRLPGQTQSSTDDLPLYEIQNVQLGPDGELALLEIVPGH